MPSRVAAKIAVLPLLPAADRPATKWPVEIDVRALHTSNMFVERPPMTAIEPTRFAALGSHYRQQADACLRVANEALSPYDEEWLRLAAYWAELAREAETKCQATSDFRAGAPAVVGGQG